MRFVPTNCLRTGTKIGKNLYGNNNEILLRRGTIITSTYIESIKRLNFSGIYVDDEISRDIEINDVIPEKLRNETTNSLKGMFIKAERGRVPSLEKIKESVYEIIDELLRNPNMVVNMLDLKCFDNYTYAHSVNVAVLSIIIGISCKLKRDTLVLLGLSAILHDIGKVFIDKRTLNKPGKLTDEEYELLKKHPEQGIEYLNKHFMLTDQSIRGIIDHHEKIDGSGYPEGKCGDEISLFGKIIAIADVYDALTSKRPYREALNPSDALEYIMGGSGTLFEHSLVELFLNKIEPYPIGAMVQLSNGWTGIVIKNYNIVCTRPKIRVISKSNKPVDPFEISLFEDMYYLNVIITGVILNDSEMKFEEIG